MTPRRRALTPQQRIMLMRCADRGEVRPSSGGELATLRSLGARALMEECRVTWHWRLTESGWNVLRQMARSAAAREHTLTGQKTPSTSDVPASNLLIIEQRRCANDYEGSL